ncbi:MAG: pyrimidine dimer DNA glycosylase/endonuclease V [Acidobacteria bacterium]|nr:pyrimidine dimer DNA glycosylase/endonuclease V [Acidobacteriota bacterium]
MRLWSLHPRYLDARGLVAAWREALLAQAVLAARTRGYREHPQLVRFRAHPEPARAIAAYLHGLHAESVERGYLFDAGRIAGCDAEGIDGAAPGRIGGCDAGRVPVTRGQIAFERTHLLAKLCARDPRLAARLRQARLPTLHPLFRVVPGGVEPWERAAEGRSST